MLPPLRIAHLNGRIHILKAAKKVLFFLWGETGGCQIGIIIQVVFQLFYPLFFNIGQCFSRECFCNEEVEWLPFVIILPR